MQCPSCKFENMPGSPACARCASPMDLVTRPIDVHPPRARRWAKPGRMLLRQGKRSTGSIRSATGGMDVGPPEIHTFSMFGRMLLPGWPQFALNRKGRGYVFAIGGALGFLVGLLYIGSLLGTLSLGFLLSMHAASISDAFAPPEPRLFRSLFSGTCTYCFLIFLIYAPIGWTVTRFVRPQTLNHDVFPYHEGDVLLLRVTHVPRRGDLVVYNARAMTFNVSEHRVVRTRDGAAIDRVLGVAGDQVTIKDGTIFINGQSTPFPPLGRVALPPATVTVPPGAVFLLPSQVMLLGASLTAGDASGTVVTCSDVDGVLFAQTQPLSRFGWIH